MTKDKMPVVNNASYDGERQQRIQASLTQSTTSTRPATLPDHPPPYTTSESQSSAAATSALPAAIPNPLPPQNAQRAQAPLKISTTNSRIEGAFVIVGFDTGKTQPDAYFKTTNSSIATSVWFEEMVARPVVVEAWTTNSSIDMSVVSSSLRTASHQARTLILGVF
jgi:hypothetical protein